MNNKVFISEIFESVQGEGIYVGVNQLFVRFTKCNLSCKYCDTDFSSKAKEYSKEELLDKINNYKNVHSVSLTGGEPLLETEFLKSFLPFVKTKIYLETNGVLHKNLEQIINYVDIISMDIKLKSATGMKDYWGEHQKFIEIGIKNKKEIFLKVVFDENITDEEIENCVNLAKNDGLWLILQPKMDKEKLNISSEIIKNIFYKFSSLYKNIRLIPQVHKFLNIE